MRKIKLFFLTLALLVGGGNSIWAADMVVGEKFTKISDLNGQLFAIVNETAGTAMGIGITGHGSGWDMYFGTYNEAYGSNACYYKIEAAQGDGVENYYYLRTYNSAGSMYTAWNASLYGYFNSQPGTGGYFALGLENRNGQDALNHAVWDIEVSEGKFAIKNIGTGKYLHADQTSNTYTDPFYFTFCTLIEDPLPAAKEKYSALKAKYLAINSALDVTTADALYESATTVDDVQGAINELVSKFGTYLVGIGSETDLTSLITNPSFESSFTGWTNKGMATQGNKVFGGTEGNTYCEVWQPNGTFGVSQTLTLPQGYYCLTANSLARGVTSAKLYAGNKETAITIVDAANTYIAGFYVSDADVTIGFESVGTGAGNSWICVDNFQLKYIQNQNMTDEEYANYVAHKEAIAAYEKALTAAQALLGTLPTTANTNLQTVITNNTVIDGTTVQYNDATTALNDAATAAKLLIDSYAEYLDTKNGAIAMKDANTYTGADAKSTLEGVISTTSTNVEAATDASAIETERASLVTAAKAFVKNVTIKADECLDITCLITNPHFKRGGNANATGWNLESGSVGERRASTHNFEAWHRSFNLSQTITDLPKGTYKVTLQGFARHDNGAITDKTNLYCGIVNQEIKNITAESSTTSYYKNGDPQMGDNNYDSKEGNDYRPFGMTGAYYWFQQTNPATGQPFYTNEVQTLITEDGDLKIGFKCETNEDWVIWDNFHLYYYGSAIAVTIDENQPISFSEDVEDANITLNRAIAANKWNTVALPFALTDAETKTAFGNDVEVATFSETAEDGMSTIEFNVAADAAIAANIPILLKTSTAGTTYSFNGKTIKAGEAKVEGSGNFDFVGTYAASTTIAENDYFISSDKLYKSKGNTTIQGTRAYIKRKSNSNPEARIIKLSIDGEEVTAVEGIKVIGINNGKIHNLNGQEVKNAQKGIFIQNGKKIVVK